MTNPPTYGKIVVFEFMFVITGEKELNNYGTLSVSFTWNILLHLSVSLLSIVIRSNWKKKMIIHLQKITDFKSSQIIQEEKPV